MIAVPVKHSGDNPDIDERFGRCEKFCIINDNDEFKIIDNSAKDLGSGAGGQVVQLLSMENVDTIISNHIGPKAMTAINALEINVFEVGEAKTVKEALKLLKLNKLKIVKDEIPGLRRM